ncbi:hypothetical protein TrLO_g8003 [Triparma laevis f. longispina]|uniref:Uncharacterized protein n=1 Tax=Triparma laevis f. longispina TaxID=1714387 RepID=A0A9W6ZWY2_9STRA|nr:hypothetical protein TrLO_g8003 [Triparma laevis f. longispina]
MRTCKGEGRGYGRTSYNVKGYTTNTSPYRPDRYNPDMVTTPSSPINSPLNSIDVIWFSCNASSCAYKAKFVGELEAHKRNEKLDKCPMLPDSGAKSEGTCGELI